MARCLRLLSVALVALGILSSATFPLLAATAAQTNNSQAEKTTTQGNPSVKVWVNTKSHVYHCSGTRYYGNTKNGLYMSQSDAQQKGNRPAYGKVCR